MVQADKDAKSGTVLNVFRAAEDAQFSRVTGVGQAANSQVGPVSPKPSHELNPEQESR
jgi:hypothetical protein